MSHDAASGNEGYVIYSHNYNCEISQKTVATNWNPERQSQIDGCLMSETT